MPKKNSLFGPNPLPSVSAKSMATSFVSDPVAVQFLDNFTVQIVATGAPAGTFAVQVSNDYDPNNSSATPDWQSLILQGGTPTLTGSPDNINIYINQLPSPYVRIAYTATSGSGSCNIFVAGKEI